MLKLFPEQLQAQLNKKLHSVYLLLGNDHLLLQESQNLICQTATIQKFNERYLFQIDNNTNWQEIFALCQLMSLFTSKKILILTLPVDGLNALINEQLAKLAALLHSDLILIICGNKLTKMQEKATWIILLDSQAVLVKCHTPDQTQLSKWVANRSHQLNLQLDEPACQLLCHYYEGNLLALAQILDQLSLIWPNSRLTLPHVKQIVSDTSYFTPTHWVDALLAAKSKRALHILQQLHLEGSEPMTLLRILQRNLLLLVTLKRQSKNTPLRLLFDKHRILQNNRAIISEALNRFNHDQLRKVVHSVTLIEVTLNKEYSQSVWTKLESLSLMLCHKPLASVFIDS